MYQIFLSGRLQAINKSVQMFQKGDTNRPVWKEFRRKWEVSNIKAGGYLTFIIQNT